MSASFRAVSNALGKKPGIWRPVHTEPCLQTGATSDRFRSSCEAGRIASRTPLAGCNRGPLNVHWDKIGVPLSRRQLVPGLRRLAILRELLQLYLGTMHEDGILGGDFYTPPSRTPLSLDAM
jgi:hypothetical protein